MSGSLLVLCLLNQIDIFKLIQKIFSKEIFTKIGNPPIPV